MDSIEQVLNKAAVLKKRSRSLLLFAVVTAAMSARSVQAQTFAEWFKQKSTQKKYLYQQIAALQVYSGYLNTGYRIAKGGLGTISSYVGKEFALHDSYYTYLKTTSRVVRDDPQVRIILRRQADILGAANNMNKLSGLTGDERNYIDKVRKALLNDCDARLSDLSKVLENGKTSMSDEERLRQIGRIHGAMQDNYLFASRFLSDLNLYLRNKRTNQQDLNTLSELYGSH